MQLSSIFALLIVMLSLSFTTAQRCVGRPNNPSCSGARNIGTRGRRCTPRTMWYYDAQRRECVEMQYRGCGGNNNRWCSKRACEERCRR